MNEMKEKAKDEVKDEQKKLMFNEFIRIFGLGVFFSLVSNVIIKLLLSIELTSVVIIIIIIVYDVTVLQCFT